MSLTAADVSEIIRLLEESSFDELNLQIGDLKLRLRRGENGIAADAAAPAPDQTFEPLHKPVRPERAPSPSEGRSRRASPQEAEPGTQPPPATDGAIDVPSPLLGIYYRAPKPGAPPFVELGQAVEEDTIIGIIEVMKLMNSIRAGVRGEVVDIPAPNGALVEYGDPLIRVRPPAE